MDTITIDTIVEKEGSQVWRYWTEPEHIQQWNHASDDWECPHAENNLIVGGSFLARMSAKDGSVGFDFGGVYTDVIPLTKIAYTIGDGRQVVVSFEVLGENRTRVVETFDPETENSPERQREGWQSILDNFKQYAEAQNESQNLY